MDEATILPEVVVVLIIALGGAFSIGSLWIQYADDYRQSSIKSFVGDFSFLSRKIFSIVFRVLLISLIFIIL